MTHHRTTPWTRTARTALFVLAPIMMFGQACEDDPPIVSSTATTSTSGGGDCTDASECPGEDTTCSFRVCLNNTCGMSNAVAQTACTEDGGVVCDGFGQCVDPCSNGVLDGSETDVDCGGTCGPCINGLDCTGGADCGSGLCVDGVCCESACDGACEQCNAAGLEGFCTAAPAGEPGTPSCAPYVCDGTANSCPSSCTANADCDTDSYCDTGGGTCVAKQADGETCGDAAECDSGNCADGYCCDVACTDACGSCDIAGSEGVCSPDAAGTDPGGDCTNTCDGGGLCAEGGVDWSGTYGDGGSERVFDVAVDGNGNVIVVGDFTGTINFGASGDELTSNDNDIFVAKFDPDGNHIWSKSFGDSAAQRAWAVAVDSANNILITGNFTGQVNFGASGDELDTAGGDDIFLAKLSPAGAHMWSKKFGDTTSQYALDVAVGPNNTVVITGWYQGTFDFGGGNLTPGGGFDLFVAKFAANGDYQAANAWGNAATQKGQQVVVDDAGNIYVTGDLVGTMDFGNGNTVGGTNDIFLVKLDDQLDFVWGAPYGSTASVLAAGIALDAANNIILGCNFTGSFTFDTDTLTSTGQDVCLAGFDDDGNHLWSTSYGDAGTDNLGGLAVDPNSGAIVMVGNYTAGAPDFGGGALTTATTAKVFLAKLANDTSHLWSVDYGTSGTVTGRDVAIGAGSQIASTGDLDGEVTFDAMAATGTADVWVLQSNP